MRELFFEWLQQNFPLRAEHVISRVVQLRGGRLNDPNFGSRMRGTGLDAELATRLTRVMLPFLPMVSFAAVAMAPLPDWR